jgi:hypothetical protein
MTGLRLRWPEEPREPFLFEVAISGESLANTTVLHQREADRIAQRITFVQAVFQEIKTLPM